MTSQEKINKSSSSNSLNKNNKENKEQNIFMNTNNSEKWAANINFDTNTKNKNKIKNLKEEFNKDEELNHKKNCKEKRREKEPRIKNDDSDEKEEIELENNNIINVKEKNKSFENEKINKIKLSNEDNDDNGEKKENEEINDIDELLIKEDKENKKEQKDNESANNYKKINIEKKEEKIGKKKEIKEIKLRSDKRDKNDENSDKNEIKIYDKQEKSENEKKNQSKTNIKSERRRNEIKLINGEEISESLEKKRSTHRGLKRKNVTILTGSLDNRFNLDEIGKIKIAEQHASANRILKQINNFDAETKFCPCCCLPCEKDGTLVRFSYCDDTDKFIDFGQGTTLYFSFFKYSIIVMAATAIIIGIPFLIFSYQYTYALQKVCTFYYLNEFNILEKKDLLNYCDLYITAEDYAADYYSVVDSPFFLFSSVNIKDYRNIYHRIYKDNESDNFEKSILNFPILSFICSITLLIINILYTIIIYNKNTLYDFQITSPSDYTVLITNMHSVLSHYLSIRKEYEILKQNDPNKLNEDGTKFDFEKEMNKKLGISELLSKNQSKKEKNEKIKGSKKGKKHKKGISRLKQFTAFIENNICIGPNKEKYQVEQLNICFKLNNFMNLEEELHSINTQIVKTKNHPYQIKRNEELGLEGSERKYFGSMLSGYNLFWFNCCEKGIELSKLEKEKTKIENDIETMINSEDIDENNFAGVAFVSFNTLKEQEDFLSQFPSNIISYFLKIIWDLKYIFCFCCIKKDLKANLDVVIAPEPEDVIFENLEYSSIKKTFRTIVVYIISIILIGICFGIFIGLNIWQEQLNNKAIHFILSYVISLLNTCVSSILNIIFQMILDFLTKMEKQNSMTEYYRSYSAKLTIFTFFTSAVVPLICELIRRSDGYEILISNMLMMFLVNAFVTPIMWTLNFTFFLKKFRICLIKWNKAPNDVDKYHNMTQRELNDLYELPDMSISYKYSYLAKTLLMTFLYIPIFPLGIAISLVGFILGYLLEKFNYSQMYKRPEMLNHKLCVFYVNHFDVVIFVYAIGDYIFMHNVYENRIIPLVKIIIFAVITIIPYSKFLKKSFIGITESNIKSAKFSEKFFTFSTDYERANPMTRKKGIKHYLKKLLESKKISFKDYRKYLAQSDSLNLMQVYYESRTNKSLFDAQRNFAKAIGNRFFNLKKLNDIIINSKDDDNYNNDNNLNFLNVREENIQPCANMNNEGMEVKEEDNNEKQESKKIANIYNNPFFMDFGCTIQTFVKEVVEKSVI